MTGKTAFEMVKDFHRAYRQPIGTKAAWPESDRIELRVRLIKEEFDEVLKAISNGEDLVNFAKELADLNYVVNGFAVEAGINLDKVTEEVHRSNMSKLDDNGMPIYREDGKVLKGSNYFEPDLEKILIEETL